MNKIILFASGSGSNVENIIRYFNASDTIKVAGVFCNNPHATVIGRALHLGIPVVVFSKEELKNGLVLQKLKSVNPDLIVLAGFLLQLPQAVVNEFSGKTINIHPALLPKYGGKGMYGHHVHNAVFDNKEKESGITIHWVNEDYDEGKIIFQKAVSIADCKSGSDVARKVLQLEHEFFPKVIAQVIAAKNSK